jgi:hypothetical protein
MTKTVTAEILGDVTDVLPEEMSLLGIVSVCGLIVTQYAESEEDAMHIIMELAVQVKNYYRSTSTEQCDCARCKAKRKELN